MEDIKRICKKCIQEKNIEEFIKVRKKYTYVCKECRKEYQKKYFEKYKERTEEIQNNKLSRKSNSRTCKKCFQNKSLDNFKKIKRDSKEYYVGVCNDCLTNFQKEYHLNNRQKRLDAGNKRHQKNREKDNNRNKKWYSKNKEYVNKYRKIRKNTEEYRSWAKKYYNKPEIRIVNRLRGRIYSIKKCIKSDRTMKLIGCDVQFLLNHLQQSATNNGYIGFDINTYSGKQYHIDHIIPCDAFNLKCSYHQRLCFNWSNLQILKAGENLTKSSTFKMEDI